LRVNNLGENGASLQIEEEASYDDEVVHHAETVGYMIVYVPEPAPAAPVEVWADYDEGV